MLRSLLRQTRADWRALVVGDHCGPATEAAVRAPGDPRIDYVNLPRRCGEQAIPNSVGMALVETPYLAFLNHDDLLLPDHLEHGLERLSAHGAELFLGRSAIAMESVEDEGGRVRPIFSDTAPRSFDPGRAIRCDLNMFEPCSAWIVETRAARRVGPWRPSRGLFRTSLNDWLLRAWAAGLTVAPGERITLLRMVTHYQRRYYVPTGVYSVVSREHQYAEALLEEGDAARVREWIARDIAASPTVARDEGGPLRRWGWWILDHVARPAYRYARLDLHPWLFRARGRALQEYTVEHRLHRRTGEEAAQPEVELDALIDYARDTLGEQSAARPD